MSKALRFPQIAAKHQDFPLFFTVFLTIKTLSQNIPITLLQNPFNFTNSKATIGGKSFQERFHTLRNNAASIIGNGVISLL